MKHHLLLAATLLLAGTAAHAQVRFAIGPQGSYLLTTASYHYDYSASGSTSTTGYRSSFAAGFLAEIGFGHVALQPAIQYARKGATQAVVGPAAYLPFAATIRYRLDYLTLPLNVAFTQHADGQGAQLFAGPYVGVLLGGETTADVTYQNTPGVVLQSSSTRRLEVGTPYIIGVSDYYTHLRRVDAGLQGGIGYRYHGLLLQAGFSLGFTNANEGYDPQPTGYPDSPTYRNRAFQLSLAYLFGPKT